MPNLIDVLSDSGLRTGEVLPRAEIHRLGKIHRAVHLYILNPANEVLLQRRSLTVDHAPGRLGISVVGHVDAGEPSSALRELFPGHLGCGWDARWAAKIRAKANADLQRHLREAGLSSEQVDTSPFVLCMGEAREAEDRGDRVAFQEAARQAVREGRRAVRGAAAP